MIDRELLELAAKAAGVFMTPADWPYSDSPTPEYFALEFDEEDRSITGTRVWYGSGGEIGGTEKYPWNPFTNDGDALRLSVKLRLETVYTDDNTIDVRWRDNTGDFAGNVVEEFGSLRNGDDPFAAIRRAIVRAAAEIGKAMP